MKKAQLDGTPDSLWRAAETLLIAMRDEGVRVSMITAQYALNLEDTCNAYRDYRKQMKETLRANCEHVWRRDAGDAHNQFCSKCGLRLPTEVSANG